MAAGQTKCCCWCKQHKAIDQFNRNQFYCRLCASERFRAWRIANRDHHAHRNNRWYHLHCDRASAGMKLYRQHNAEFVSVLKRDYHARNAEIIRAKVGAWAKANPHKRKAQIHKRLALKNSRPTDWTDRDIAFAIQYFNGRCAVCRRERKICWDHWIPLACNECPGTIPMNMVPLCQRCNSQKQSRPAAKWLNERFNEQTDRILRRVARYFRLVRTTKGSFYVRRVQETT